MTIRALTGFNQETINKYGRAYSPVNGITALGAIPTAPEYESDTKIQLSTSTLITIGVGLLLLTMIK